MSFPTNPIVGQTYVNNGITYQFNAQGAWKAVNGSGTILAPQQALIGVGQPPNSLGVDSDYYVDLGSGLLYGPRSGGVWPASGGTSVFTYQNLMSGIGAPGAPAGGNGNYYLDIQSGLLYGPKAAGAWPPAAIAQIFSPQSLLSGSGAPASSVGTNTDYYVDLNTGLLYGPKSGGVWPASSGVSIFSPQAFIAGVGAPSNTVGSNGNFYVDLSTGLVYGPKVSGVWPVNANASIFSVQSLLSGVGAPSNTLGSNGNFYQDIQTGNYYGPKAAGAWPATFGGVYGPGSVLLGTGAPPNSFGLNGNYYLDQASGLLYGPKAAGVWPAGAVLIPAANFISGNSAGSAPVNTIGANGNYFYDTFSAFIWGPKAAGVWPTLPISSGRQAVADSAFIIGAGIRQVAMTALTASRVITLPLANSRPAGTEITLIDETGNCSAVVTLTLACAGSDTMNGAVSAALTSPYASISVETNGNNEWTIRGLNNASANAAQPPQGRLTLTSLTPLLLATVSAAAVVFFTPYLGNQIPLWNGSQFINAQFGQLSNTLANSSVGNAGPFAACANAVYDMYVWGTGALQTLTRSDMWQQTGVVTNTNASPAVFTQTAHGCLNGTPVRLSVAGGSLSPGFTVGQTYYMVNVAANTFQLAATPGGAAINAGGAASGTITATEGIGIGTLTTNTVVRGAANAQSQVNGLLVNSLAIANGPNAGFGTYVGSVMTDASGATVTLNLGGSGSGGVAASVGLWNAYNQVPLTVSSLDTLASHSYALTPWRTPNGSTTTGITFLTGVAGASNPRASFAQSYVATSAATALSAIGLDSTSVPVPISEVIQGAVAADFWNYSALTTNAILGAHTLYPLESTNGSAIGYNTLGTTGNPFVVSLEY